MFGVPFCGLYLGLVPLMGLEMLQYSQQWQAADIFRAAPIPGPAPAVPRCTSGGALLACPADAAVGWIDRGLLERDVSQLILLLPGVVAMPVFSLVPQRGGHGVPLSQAADAAKGAGRGLAMSASCSSPSHWRPSPPPAGHTAASAGSCRPKPCSSLLSALPCAGFWPERAGRRRNSRSLPKVAFRSAKVALLSRMGRKFIHHSTVGGDSCRRRCGENGRKSATGVASYNKFHNLSPKSSATFAERKATIRPAHGFRAPGRCQSRPASPIVSYSASDQD